jgi:SagB-type dehydrogenase family enzyme
MWRRRVGRIVDVGLLVAAVLVLLTGVVVDQLDLHEFTPHRWAGYLVAALIPVHVWLHMHRATGTGSHQSQLVRSAEPPALRPTSAEPVRSPEVSGEARGRPSRRTALVASGAGIAGVATGWLANTETSSEPYEGGDVGLFYHRESSLGLLDLLGTVVNWGRRPAPYTPVGTDASVPLPAIGTPPAMSVAQALTQRRSRREYADRAITGQQLAWVLWAATGITTDAGYRTAPSAGALYPIETYVAVKQVAGIEPGLYHLDVRGQALEQVRTGSVATDLMLAALGQDFLQQAAAVVVLTGLFQRTRWKYHARHYRYVCWEGGHLAQNVYLAAEAAGLAACMVGGFLDGTLNRLLRVDGRQEAALGLITVGPR